jgi:hypothetical protein
MLIRDLMKAMLLPKEEILINKIVNIRGIDVHLISLTYEEHRKVLWALYRSPYNFYEGIHAEFEKEFITKKDELTASIDSRKRDNHIHIEEISIQKQKMTFTSSSLSPIYNNNCEEYMQLLHFIENGMSTVHWEEEALENLVIAAYEQKEDEEFPEIDMSKELDITIKVSKDYKEVLVNQPMCLEFGEAEKDKRGYYYDSVYNIHRSFYIDKLYHYDIWEEVDNRFDSEMIHKVPKEHFAEMREQYFGLLEKTCPVGKNLVMLEYETEDGVQLNFYSREYLQEKPEPKSSSSSILLFKSDRELGTNGFKSRVCMIQPVEKDYTGSIEVELFSMVVEIPEVVITV